jgi:ubiquinone/menaquinone biosynthesis C-methylase UbiE
VEIGAVHDYWQADPCAAKLAKNEPGTREFYDEIERAKLRVEPHEPAFAEFDKWAGRNVLEIGCGVGIDTARFARAGASITAIDLTEAAAGLANRLLQLEGLPGQAIVGNAEELPFVENSFDLVYSWGVLHHTPNIVQAVSEVRRVLRPGGEARVMLYSRRSIFAFAVWGRQMLRERTPLTIQAAISNGLESPGTRALTPSEAASLFAGFEDVVVQQVATRYDPLPVKIDRLGWHLLIRAKRPS